MDKCSLETEVDGEEKDQKIKNLLTNLQNDRYWHMESSISNSSKKKKENLNQSLITSIYTSSIHISPECLVSDNNANVNSKLTINDRSNNQGNNTVTNTNTNSSSSTWNSTANMNNITKSINLSANGDTSELTTVIEQM